MAVHNSYYLIGPMASGKSTIGRLLATEYGYDYVDTDDKIYQEYGTFADIFDECGQEGFRELESRIIKDIVSVPSPQIVSLGGGAPLKNRDLLEGLPLAYITVSYDDVKSRLTSDEIAKRPLLAGKHPDEVQKIWEDLAQERHQMYADLAEIVIEGSYKSPFDIAGEIACYFDLVPYKKYPSSRQ